MSNLYKDTLDTYHTSLAKVDARYRELETARIRHLWCEDKLKEADRLCIQNGFQKISSLILPESVVVSEFNQELIGSTLRQIESKFTKYRASNTSLNEARALHEREFKDAIQSLELRLHHEKEKLNQLSEQINQLKSTRISYVLLFSLASFLAFIMSYWYVLPLVAITSLFILINYR
jgi:DNA repair exonuclease SbcCD ATPase subunit